MIALLRCSGKVRNLREVVFWSCSCSCTQNQHWFLQCPIFYRQYQVGIGYTHVYPQLWVSSRYQQVYQWGLIKRTSASLHKNTTRRSEMQILFQITIWYPRQLDWFIDQKKTVVFNTKVSGLSTTYCPVASSSLSLLAKVETTWVWWIFEGKPWENLTKSSAL